MLPFDIRYFAALLLVAGCASPNPLGNLMSRNKQNESLNDVLAQRQRATLQNNGQRDSFAAESSSGIIQAGGIGSSGIATRGEDPRVAEFLQTAGRAWQSGNTIAARAAYEQVTTIQPEHVYAHSQLAILADNEQRFADAERHYRVVLRKQPNNPDVLSNIGWSYLLQNRYEESEHVLQQALQITPRHQKATFNLGWLYGKRNDYETARRLFLSAGSEAQAQRALAELFPYGPPAGQSGQQYADGSLNGIPNPGALPSDNRPGDLRSNAAPQSGVTDLVARRDVGPADPAQTDASSMNPATKKLYEEMQKERAKQAQHQQNRENRTAQQGHQGHAAQPNGNGVRTQYDPRLAPTEYVPPRNQKPGQVDPRQLNDIFRQIDAQAALSPTQPNQPQKLIDNGYGRDPRYAPTTDPAIRNDRPDPRSVQDAGSFNGVQGSTVGPQWPGPSGQAGNPATPPNQITQLGGMSNNPPPNWGNPSGMDVAPRQGVDNAIYNQQNWGSQNGVPNGANSGQWPPSQSFHSYPGASPGQPPTPLQQAQATAAQLGLNMGPGAMFPTTGATSDATSGGANYRPNPNVQQAPAPIRGPNSLPQAPNDNSRIEFGPIHSTAPQGPVIRPTGGIQGADRSGMQSGAMQSPVIQADGRQLAPADGRKALAPPEVTNAGHEVWGGAPAQGQIPSQKTAGGMLPEWPQRPLSNGVIPAPIVPSAQSQVYSGSYNGQPQITPGASNQSAASFNSLPRAQQLGPAIPNWQPLPPRNPQ